MYNLIYKLKRKRISRIIMLGIVKNLAFRLDISLLLYITSKV